MTNLGDKSHINNYLRRVSSRYRIVRGPYLTNTDKPQQLTNLGVWRYFSNMGNNPILIFSIEFVKYWWGLSNMGPLQYGTGMKYVANNFSKGDPLQLLKWWNRAFWLAEKRSHGQFWGLSLVESTVCVFYYTTESRGVCPIWVGFVKSWILPTYDKPWWQIPYNNYSRHISSRYRIVRGPYLTNTDKPQQLSPISGFVGICQIWAITLFWYFQWSLSNMGGVCQIWAPYNTVPGWNTSRIILVWCFLEFFSFINIGEMFTDIWQIQMTNLYLIFK